MEHSLNKFNSFNIYTHDFVINIGNELLKIIAPLRLNFTKLQYHSISIFHYIVFHGNRYLNKLMITS